VVVDATDAAPRHSMRAEPMLTKLNRDELRQTFAVTTASSAEAAATAHDGLDARSPDRAAAFVVTLGSAGAVLVASSGGAYHVAAPEVGRVNSIGAGDALTAGLVTGVRRRWTWGESLQFAVAVAASDVETIVPGMPSASRAEALGGSLAAVRLA